jgi:hypothetical protein
MRFPVLNAGWTQWVVSAYTRHNQLCPPVPNPALNVPGFVEGPAPMGWPPGFLSHKKASTVIVDGKPGIQQGHDVGFVIPHLAVPMNALCGVNTLLSKHKVMVPVSRVLLQGNPAGTFLFVTLGLHCANPVSLPCGVLILLKCTVWTGFDWTDLAKALGYIALDVALDLLWNKAFKGTWLGKPNDKRPPLLKLPTLNTTAGNEAKQILKAYFFFQKKGDLFTLLWRRRRGLEGAKLVTRHMLPQLGSKVIDHVLKSWIVGPLATGAPRGQVKIGKGDILTKKIVDAEWW